MTATDLVLVVTQMLRKKGVVGKFVEFYGPGLDAMSLPDRATIANMAPEYGATMGFFPVDQETLAYMQRTGRTAEEVDLVDRYYKEQGLFRTSASPDPRLLEHALPRSGHGRGGNGRPEAATGSRPPQRHEEPVAERPVGRLRQGEPGHARPGEAQRRLGRADRRRGGDRRHHELYQHEQSVGDDRGRPLARNAVQKGLHRSRG